jgi:hypothetical protein
MKKFDLQEIIREFLAPKFVIKSRRSTAASRLYGLRGRNVSRLSGKNLMKPSCKILGRSCQYRVSRNGDL